MESSSTPEHGQTPVVSHNGLPRKPKKPFTFVVALAVVFLAGLLVIVLSQNKSNEPTKDSGDNKQATVSLEPAQVTITKDGFVPATIKVKKGQAVTWVNQDSEPHQVATDVTSEASGFDDAESQETLMNGDSFSFMFEKVGTLTYSDKLNPLDFKGQVIVE